MHHLKSNLSHNKKGYKMIKKQLLILACAMMLSSTISLHALNNRNAAILATGFPLFAACVRLHAKQTHVTPSTSRKTILEFIDNFIIGQLQSLPGLKVEGSGLANKEFKPTSGILGHLFDKVLIPTKRMMESITPSKTILYAALAYAVATK